MCTKLCKILENLGLAVWIIYHADFAISVTFVTSRFELLQGFRARPGRQLQIDVACPCGMVSSRSLSNVIKHELMANLRITCAEP